MVYVFRWAKKALEYDLGDYRESEEGLKGLDQMFNPAP
jgi:hypothetical protein